MKKNLNLTVFEHQDSLLMFGYLQHGFGMLEVTRVAYTVATPNDGGLTIPTLRHRQDRFFLEPVVFLGGKMCFFELNIGSWTVNVLPLKYTIQLHANELFDIYIIWILQLGEIPG